jgi:hypothetical protein
MSKKRSASNISINNGIKYDTINDDSIKYDPIKDDSIKDTKKNTKRRKTKWTTTHLKLMKKAISIFRNGLMNSVQIEKKFDVPPRSLRRYLKFSKDPDDTFYLEKTQHEKNLNNPIKMMIGENISEHIVRKIIYSKPGDLNNICRTVTHQSYTSSEINFNINSINSIGPVNDIDIFDPTDPFNILDPIDDLLFFV